MSFRIQIGGKDYTREQLRNDPEAAREVLEDNGNVQVANVVHGDQNGIQAGVVNGTIHFD